MKFEAFRGVVHVVVNRAFGALRNWPQWRRPFGWVDLTSGPGLDQSPGGSTLEATPICGMDGLRDARERLGVPFEAFFFEQHIDRCDDLERELRQRYGPPMPQGDYAIMNGEARVCLQQLVDSGWLQGTLGAFVYDPTEQVDLDFLADIATKSVVAALRLAGVRVGIIDQTATKFAGPLPDRPPNARRAPAGDP